MDPKEDRSILPPGESYPPCPSNCLRPGPCHGLEHCKRTAHYVAERWAHHDAQKATRPPDKLTVYEVEAAGQAGVSLKNIALPTGLWSYTGGVMRDGVPFQLTRDSGAFFIDGLPPGRAEVEWDEDDPPGLVRAYLKGYPLISGAGRSREAAAEGLRCRLLKEAADPVGWLGALAEECRAEAERLEREENGGDLDQIEGWQHLELAYRNAIRIVEAASAVAKVGAYLQGCKDGGADAANARRGLITGLCKRLGIDTAGSSSDLQAQIEARVEQLLTNRSANLRHGRLR